MTEKHFILATAGHVDHGKSALVKALTGIDPDRLPEEKARQITIDLGFAELNVVGPEEQRFHIGIVDVPGHEDFVRNMIAGVGSIDLALLVVAADDGWMPQTEEHVQILNYLRVQRGVVALTKSDLGGIDVVAEQIREKLRDTRFARASIVPTSIRTGEGIDSLKDAVATELAMSEPQPDIGKPRLFVDRAFTLRGIGTVVTGTLSGGSIRRSQDVFVQPGNVSARVRSIQNHGRNVEIAQPGMRTAINLPDLSIGENGIQRGDIITVDSLGSPQATIDVLLERSSRLKRNSPAARPIKNGSSVQVHFGTGRIAAKITLLDQPAVGAGQSAIARLRLDSPIVALVGDRFVIRDSSEQNTIAGGTVLDPDADRANFRSPAQIQFLRARETAPHDVDVCVRSQLQRDRYTDSKTLLVKSNFSADEISEALSRLSHDGEIMLAGGIISSASYWHTLINSAATSIDRAHEENPERRGVDLSEFRTDLEIESDKLFSAVILELTRNGFVRFENQIARVSHQPSLPLELLSVAENIRAALSAKRFDPPDRKGLSEDRNLQQALRFLIDKGEIVEITREIVVLREAAEQMQKTITEFLSEHRSATASQLRQKIGTTRRVIIPFLEYLDRTGVTRRIGDERVLAKKSAAAKLTDAARAQRT
ncbi:MAG: selenocysteine-specific translation elongation factor [Verrucomicrobia bacterium 13_1_20CM_4_54_11]|nr:MAG: selenocysteine-specific translation elongation factor [Verrucomicrobia bacterium 13_1_20CM_4_54_11]